MTYLVHFEWPDGTEDTIAIKEDSFASLREKTDYEMEKRKATYCWSEEIKEAL